MNFQRFKILVEYDGRPFAGWQTQPDAPSVQEALSKAVAALSGNPEVIGAGRTDSGVHASGQVAHIELPGGFERRKVRDALNAHLRPLPIAVLKASAVDDTFHARFDATRRHYRYLIENRRANLTWQEGLVWRMPQKLDAKAMHDAAQQLLGTHDFTTFRDLRCQAKSPVKTLDAIAVARDKSRVIVTCTARSFLHRQVRSFVGSLVDVGRGKADAAWLADILKAADRTACGPVAPADGLYLERVDYDAAK